MSRDRGWPEYSLGALCCNHPELEADGLWRVPDSNVLAMVCAPCMKQISETHLGETRRFAPEPWKISA